MKKILISLSLIALLTTGCRHIEPQIVTTVATEQSTELNQEPNNATTQEHTSAQQIQKPTQAPTQKPTEKQTEAKTETKTEKATQGAVEIHTEQATTNHLKTSYEVAESYSLKILGFINTKRAENNLSPLQLDAELTENAKSHAKSMAEKDMTYLTNDKEYVLQTQKLTDSTCENVVKLLLRKDTSLQTVENSTIGISIYKNDNNHYICVKYK